MQFKDETNSYGWVSIAFHWVVAGFIFTLWFLGDSIAFFETAEQKASFRRLHISIAVVGYLFLWARIIWRLKSGHPRLDGQSNLDHWVANTAHYVMLVGITFMLISGPLLVWSVGGAIDVFDWFSIPSPMGLNVGLYQWAYRIHDWSANAIMLVVVLHMSGAFKHLMFNDDEIFLRMFVPLKKKFDKS